jgi:parallel beta-helix repeat protein
VYNNTFHGINVLDCDGSGNEISSNLVRDNVQHGVYLDNSPYNFSVTSNTIVRNGYYGLSMVGSADNQVINNSIRNNTQGGIYTTDVDNIIIGNTIVDHIIGINLTAEPAVVYNNYLNNTLDIFNTNVNSQFNTTQTAGMNIIGGPYIGGNYYASYNGTDTDGDGFGETPYNASGNMSVNDFLPLVPGAVYVPPTPSSGSSSSSGGGGGGGRSSSGSSGPVLTYLGDSSGSTTDSSTVDSSTTESSGLDTSTSESSAESSTGSSDSSSESSRTESTDTSIDRYAAPSIVTASLNAVRGMMAPVISTMKTNSILFQLVGAVALFSSILGIAHVVTRPTPVAVPVAKQVELQTVPVFIGETYMLSHETRLRKGEGEDVYVDYDIILDVHDHEHIYRRRFK